MYFKIKRFFIIINCMSTIRIRLNELGHQLIVKLLLMYWHNISFLYMIKSCVFSTRKSINSLFDCFDFQFVTRASQKKIKSHHLMIVFRIIYEYERRFTAKPQGRTVWYKRRMHEKN